MDYQLLNWDTDFFGFKTVRILPHRLERQQLAEVLSSLHADSIKLAYWASDEEVNYNTGSMGGLLVDRKTTFAISLRTLQPDTFIATDRVESYQPNIPQSEILILAEQAGAYSRFARDPSFPHEKFVALYHEWMRKCINRDLAREILIIREKDRVAGMVTLGEKEGKGDIGLIAVDQAFQGKGYGEMLVRAAQTWFINQGYKLAQVVTQGDNLPACRLYQKCGYEVSRVEYFYHFWL